MKYQILAYGHPDDLETAVTVALSQGWTLQGGVSVAVVFDRSEDRMYYTYAQAMVKPD